MYVEVNHRTKNDKVLFVGNIRVGAGKDAATKIPHALPIAIGSCIVLLVIIVLVSLCVRDRCRRRRGYMGVAQRQRRVEA